MNTLENVTELLQQNFKEHLKLLSTIYYYDTIRHITTIDSLNNVRK